MEYDRALYRVYERILDDLQASEPVLSSASSRSANAGAAAATAGGARDGQSGPALPYFLPLQCAQCLDNALDALVHFNDGEDAVENATERRRRIRRAAAHASYESTQIAFSMCRHSLRRVRIRLCSLVRGPGGFLHSRVFAFYNYEAVPRSLSDVEVTRPDTVEDDGDEEMGGRGGAGGGVELTSMSGRLSSDGLRRRGRNNGGPAAGNNNSSFIEEVAPTENGGDGNDSSSNSDDSSTSSSDDEEDGLMDVDVEGRAMHRQARQRRRERRSRRSANNAAAAQMPARARRDETGLICTQKGVHAVSKAAALWGYASLFILYCLHTTYVGAGVTTHSGVMRFINFMGKMFGGHDDRDRLVTCIEYALSTRPIEERRKLAYFDQFGDQLDDDKAAEEDENGESSNKKGKANLRGDKGSTKKGYYMKSVDTGEEGTMGSNHWFGSVLGHAGSNSTAITNATIDKGDPPLLGRDEILQVKILYGGTCLGQCSRVRHVVYPSRAGINTTSNSTAFESESNIGDDDADPLLDSTTDRIMGRRISDNSTWTRGSFFGKRNKEDPPWNQTSGVDRLSSPEFWKKPHYRFATDDALIYLDHRASVLHHINVVNVTLTERCLSSGSDHGKLSLTGRAAEILGQVFGMDTILINQLMYGIRSNDGKYRNGHLVNLESKEHWTWRRKQMEFYEDTDPFAWFMRKTGIVSLSLLTFFLLTSVTSIIVRVLTTSGVVLMFPVFTFFRLLGVPGADERLLGLSYPWIGRARNAVIRRRTHPPAHLIAAHGAKIFLYYLMYEACQAAWSAVLYGKSIPSGLQIYIFGFCMIW